MGLGVVGVVVGTKISVLGGGVVVAASQSHGYKLHLQSGTTL